MMLNSLKLLFFACTLLFSSIAVFGYTDPPEITSAEQVDETTVLLRWRVGANEINNGLKRYRIFYSKDFNHFNQDQDDQKFEEWPAQIEYLTGKENLPTPYTSFNTTTTFECYNGCIKNPSCGYVVYHNTACHMFLKSKFKSTVDENQMSSDVEICIEKQVCKVAKVKEYKNEATLSNFPANDRYSFYIALYDINLEEWSKLSAYHKFSGQEIDLRIYCKKNSNSLTLNWNQYGKFSNYILSRFNLKIWTNSNKDFEAKVVTEGIYKYKIHPDYRQLDNGNFKLAKNESECFNLALSCSACIHYIFGGGKCYRLTGLNYAKTSLGGIKDSVSYSLRSDLLTYEVPITNSESIYEVQLEYIDIYGSIGYSNKAICSNGSSNHDILDKDKEIETNNDSEYDFDDDEDDDDNENAVANEGEKPPGQPNETVPLEEENLIDKNSIRIILSNWPSLQRQVNENLVITCSVNRLSKLKWSKANDLGDEELENTEIVAPYGGNFTNLNLVFKKLTRKDQGEYVCSLESDETIKTIFTLLVTDKPSMPVILNVTRSGNKTLINWSLEDNGGLEIRKLTIKWSENFDSIILPVRSKVLGKDKLEKSKSQVSVIDAVIPPNYQVQLIVENENGPAPHSHMFTTQFENSNIVFDQLKQISKPKISEVTVVKDKTLINWSLENENNEQKINKIYVDICQNFSDPSASIETKTISQESLLDSAGEQTIILDTELNSEIRIRIEDENGHIEESRIYQIKSEISNKEIVAPVEIKKETPKKEPNTYTVVFLVLLCILFALIILYIIVRAIRNKKSSKKCEINEDSAENADPLLKK